MEFLPQFNTNSNMANVGKTTSCSSKSLSGHSMVPHDDHHIHRDSKERKKVNKLKPSDNVAETSFSHPTPISVGKLHQWPVLPSTGIHKTWAEAALCLLLAYFLVMGVLNLSSVFALFLLFLENILLLVKHNCSNKDIRLTTIFTHYKTLFFVYFM